MGGKKVQEIIKRLVGQVVDERAKAAEEFREFPDQQGIISLTTRTSRGRPYLN
jgi:hypothetical protein